MGDKAENPISESEASVPANSTEIVDPTTSSTSNKPVNLRLRAAKRVKLDNGNVVEIAPSSQVEIKDPPTSEEGPSDFKETDEKRRRAWEQWSGEDMTSLFDALNEYGKDFEAIQSYLVVKAKKRGCTNNVPKNKDQVRHFYYRTWHKVSKYLHFPEGMTRVAKELYALINYGEMRKKLGTDFNEKCGVKLNELIHQGTTAVRMRGKTYRIKTPVCPALKSLCSAEGGIASEKKKLPRTVTVEITPGTNQDWAWVQSLAHNPRVRLYLPLQKRLSCLLKHLQDKWKPCYLKSVNMDLVSEESRNKLPVLRLLPRPDAEIKLVKMPLAKENLTNIKVSLDQYARSLSISEDVPDLTSEKNAGRKSADSGEESFKSVDLKLEDSDARLCEDVNLNDSFSVPDTIDQTETSKTPDPPDKIVEIRKGWTLENACAVNIGELYLMFGVNERLCLNYRWEKRDQEQQAIRVVSPQKDTSDCSSVSDVVSKLSTLANTLMAKTPALAKKVSDEEPRSLTISISIPAPEVQTSLPETVTVKPDAHNFLLPSILPKGKIPPAPSFTSEEYRKQLNLPKFTQRPGRPTKKLNTSPRSLVPLRPKSNKNHPLAVMRKLPLGSTPATLASTITHVAVPATPPASVVLPPIIVTEAGSMAVSHAFVTAVEVSSSSASVPEYFDSPLVPMPASPGENGLESASHPSVSALTPEPSFTIEELTFNVSRTRNEGSPVKNDVALSDQGRKDKMKSFMDVELENSNSSFASLFRSPMKLLAPGAEDRTGWINEVDDFSFGSFLGAFASPAKNSTAVAVHDDVRLPSDLQSLLSENSADLTAKFADLAATMTGNNP